MMQKMKTKVSKPSTKPKKATKKSKTPIREEFQVSPWLEEYLDCFHLKYKPVTEMFLERISKELVLWSRTEEKAYKVSQFFSQKNIGYHTYMSWVKKYPLFESAFNLAKTIIGDRRESGALERKFDAGTVINMMPYYDPEWKEMTKFRTELKAQANENANTGTQFVVMEKFTLPDKKERTEPTRTPEEVAASKSDMGIERRRLSNTSIVDSAE